VDSVRHSAELVNTTAPERKTALRADRLAARARRSPDQILAAGAALAASAATLGTPTLIAAHVGVGTEPPTLPLLEALQARGIRVLLPAVLPPDALDWSFAPATPALLVDGPFGLRQPPGPYLGPAAVRAAALILVPALAVDHAGRRLGRGGGYYDRALAGRSRTTRLVAVVFDDEVLDEIPIEPHDQPMDGALTPSGLVMFGG
jgi:5-formyltetrahydrofolate cyclo-ligase